MELVPTVFAIALVVLTIVLSVVGVQMVLVLLELKKTLKKVNDALETADEKITAIIAPLQKISGVASGLGSGMKVFEAFVGWLNKDKDREVKTSGKK
jgi:hypothetical protein